MMWIPLALLLIFSGATSGISTRFTNLKCEVLDPLFVSYSQCDLKILGRGIVGLNVHAKLLKGPLTNAKANLSLWRKYNGFRPFMYNITFDFCKEISKTVHKLTFLKVFFDSVIENSNLNHTCPYENELIVKNMVIKEKYFEFFPIPSGEYQYQLIAINNNERKSKLYITFFRDEGIMKN